MIKLSLRLLVGLVFAGLFVSCEDEEDFGFPSKIEISANGEAVDIKGTNELPPSIIQLELLDYDGNGNNSGLIADDKDYIETTTDWLTVKYFSSEYKLVLNAEPNENNKKRELYLYLYSGKSRQEIKVIQNK